MLGGSVNTIEWCPEQFGMRVAAGCSNGEITLFTKPEYDDLWDNPLTWVAHQKSVNSIAWAPLSQMEDSEQEKVLLASGGSDNEVHVWDWV